MSDSDHRSPNIEDRGEAKYFHGRKGILADFKESLEFAEQDPKKGTTFLIQAAPGAGKTALLHKCAELAEGQKWKVVDIGPSELCETNTLLRTLGREKETQTKATTTSVDTYSKGGIMDMIRAGIGLSRSTTRAHAARSPLEVLKSGEGKLLLVMDEAQNFARDFAPSPSKERHDARALIDSVHNGKIAGRPVMLLTAGLSVTAGTFENMGVSRFKTNCYVELGPLKLEAERAVIQDWLQLEGRAKGDPTPWIDAIARETHGWPQHVATYAQAAALQIRTDKRAMTPQGLQAVLDVGRRQRTKFYEIRAKGLDEHHRAAIAEAFVSTREDQTQTKKEIMTSLVKAVGEQEADTVFKRALRKGVLDHRNGRYAIPIPSMRRWFIDNYFIERDPPDQSPPGQDFPPDSPFAPPPGKFPLGHGHFPESDRNIER